MHTIASVPHPGSSVFLAMSAVLFLGSAAGAAPAPAPATVSPSLEADAEYLLTTTDFMDAQFGMAVEAVEASPGRLTVRTTGAEFVFEPDQGQLRLSQRLGRARESGRVRFPAGALAGLRVERQGRGAVLLAAGGGTLRLRINGDSLLMLQPSVPMALSCQVDLVPGTLRQSGANTLVLDEWGGLGCYLATGGGPGNAAESRPVQAPAAPGLTLTHDLKAGQVLWFAVAPPKPYDWAASCRDRVVWHWSRQTGYPADAEIEAWQPYGNILLQQSEVMLWKDWSLRFLPRLGEAEFERVNRTCARLGMRNIVYTSPFYFLAGTGLESKAMNSFDHFEQTGFSPGDGRGLNWPIFLAEIARVVQEYKPDGLYFDGIYDSVVRTYLITRHARRLVGDDGILEYHATWSPPGDGVYLPQIDAHYNFVLRGEGCPERYADPEYLRYFVSTYNISNAVGVLCNNNDYRLDEAFINTLLDNNLRLHFIPGWANDYRQDALARLYWPALTPALQARVEAGAEGRQRAVAAAREELRQALATPATGARVVLAADFGGQGLSAKLPEPAPADGLPLDLPGGWSGYLSPRSQAVLDTVDGCLRIRAQAHTVAVVERALPPETTAVACRVRAEGDCGMSWGPGLVFQIGEVRARVGVRSDDRAQVDLRGEQRLYAGYPHGQAHWLRLRLVGHFLLAETSPDGTTWTCLQANRLTTTTGPRRLLTGKVPYDGGRREHSEPGGPGTVLVDAVRAYAPGP